ILKHWVNYGTPAAREMVRNILATAPNKDIGLDSHEIYERAFKEYPDAVTPTPPPKSTPLGFHPRTRLPKIPVPVPPRREHPVRSMKYLKRVILKEMAEAKEIEKVLIKQGEMTEDGKKKFSVRSKDLGLSDIIGEDLKSQCWRWRLLPPGASS
ncbi:hypothetical protein BU15DRAFT_23426, partial [Melanogaster broomeanus]